MVSDSQTVQFWPHSVIHNRKAVHLTVRKLWWKVIFGPPLKRQNFRDASGLNCYHHLISCHRACWCWCWKSNQVKWFWSKFIGSGFEARLIESDGLANMPFYLNKNLPATKFQPLLKKYGWYHQHAVKPECIDILRWHWMCTLLRLPFETLYVTTYWFCTQDVYFNKII